MSSTQAPQFGDIVEEMRVIVVREYSAEHDGWWCQLLDAQQHDRDQHGRKIMRLVRGDRLVRNEVPR
jgi:hypothetical protein